MSRVERPEDLVGLPVPDLSLPSSSGGTFAFRGRVGLGPLALFFYLRNSTPG
jgi:peroxiredoxin